METSYFNLIVTIGFTGEQEEEEDLFLTMYGTAEVYALVYWGRWMARHQGAPFLHYGAALICMYVYVCMCHVYLCIHVCAYCMVPSSPLGVAGTTVSVSMFVCMCLCSYVSVCVWFAAV